MVSYCPIGINFTLTFFKVEKHQNSRFPLQINVFEGQSVRFKFIMCYLTCPIFKVIKKKLYKKK